MMIIINTTTNNNVKDECNEEIQSPVMSYQTAMSLLLLFLMSLIIQFVSHSSAGTPVITPHSISWWSSDNICLTLKNGEVAENKALFFFPLSYIWQIIQLTVASSVCHSLLFPFLSALRFSNVRQESFVSLANVYHEMKSSKKLQWGRYINQNKSTPKSAV